mmetsp:Transcript_46333/g.107848  ORF Transcript_46333/g.107848 Transcript_46333/m.107848 type:complete len:266 (+) Transcript_46333:46-843(+)
MVEAPPAVEHEVVVDPWEDIPDDIDSIPAPSMQAYVVHADPYIAVVPNFLTEPEIEHLVQLTEGKWVRSEVDFVAGGRPKHTTGTGQANISDGHRTSSTCVIDVAQTPIVQRVEERLADLVSMELINLEVLSLVKYTPGQYFKEHHDGEYRPWTVFLYLNSLPPHDEGETHFMNIGLKVAPRAGCAVIWPNARPDGSRDDLLMHQGLAPLTGVKYGINCFFNKKHVRRPEHNVRTFPRQMRPPDIYAPAEDKDGFGLGNLFACCG